MKSGGHRGDRRGGERRGEERRAGEKGESRKAYHWRGWLDLLTNAISHTGGTQSGGEMALLETAWGREEWRRQT